MTIYEKTGSIARSDPRAEEAPRRERLRKLPDEATLAALYGQRYDHTRWADHVERVAASIAFVMANLPGVPNSIADLSTGDGAIPTGLADEIVKLSGFVPELRLGDLTPGWTYHGAIEETVLVLPPTDLLICSETVEHLDDPDDVLAEAAQVCRWLFLSTPVGEWDAGSNPEHLWGWNVGGVDRMLRTADWTPLLHALFTPTQSAYYTFQFWLAAAAHPEGSG